MSVGVTFCNGFASDFSLIGFVYYISRNGQLEHPHFMELSHLPNQHLRHRDVMERLIVSRGKGMPALYSWSCKSANSAAAMNINCLNHHLKNVRLSDYDGRAVHMVFARLIIANAEVLETLTIAVYGGNALEERWTRSKKFPNAA